MNPLPLRLVLCLAASSAALQAQTPPAPAPAPKPAPHEGQQDAPVIRAPVAASDDDVHQQMKKLIGEVEVGLRKIDKLLAEAASNPRGASKSSGADSSAIPELVQHSQDQGKEVVQAIDKILELANHQHAGSQSGNDSGNGLCQSTGSKPGGDPKSGSSSPQPGEQPGKSPTDGQRDTTTQRESTPDKPGAQDGKTPQGNQPGQAGDPRGNQKSPQSPKNQPGRTPPGSGTEKVDHGTDAREGWGYLPEQARDVFRTQGGGAMPARYREWIDAYYRKLNQKP